MGVVNVTKLAIKRPTTAILCLTTIFLLRVQFLLGAKVKLTPEVELPMLVVSTVYAGTSLGSIGELIAMKQEDAITLLDGMNTIRSCSQENVSVVMVQYEYGTNIDTAYINLKKAVDSTRSDLPDNTNGPTIIESDLDAQLVVTLMVSGRVDRSPCTYVDSSMVSLFEKLGSVGEVSLPNDQKSYIRVGLIPEKLRQYYLAILVVGQIVGTADFAIPTGEVRVGKQSLDANVDGDYNNAGGPESVAIPLTNGDVIHLSDIAEIHDALEDANSTGRYSKNDIISLDIEKQQSSTTIDVSRDVMKEIQEIEAVNPRIRATAVDDSSEIITESIPNVFQAMIMTVVLSMIVLWLSYGNLRTSVIVGTSIPAFIMLALISTSTMGSFLNVTSLTSLVLSVGMMVNDSINMLDGCFRVKEKHSFYDTAVGGSHTMIGSITDGTITTCVVFPSLTMLSGMSGQLFKQLGYTIVSCMIASLFSVVNIVPLCCYQWYPVEKENAPVNRLMKSLQVWHRKNMPSIISRARLIIGTSILLLAATFLLASRLNVDLMSSVDEGVIQMTIEAKPGLSIKSVNETPARVEDMIINGESVGHYLLTYSSSGLSVDGDGVTLNTYLKDNRELSTDGVTDQWKQETGRYKDVSTTTEQGSTTNSSTMDSSDRVEASLQSADYDALKIAAGELADTLQEKEDVIQVHPSVESAAPAIKVKIDPVKAQAEELTLVGIGSVIYNSLSGMDISTARINGENMDIRVEYTPDRYDTIDKLQGMTTTTATGTALPLEDLGDVYYEDNPQQIEWKDRQYQAVIAMEPQTDYKKTTEKNVKKFVDSWEFPAEVEPAVNSVDKTVGEELDVLGGALGAGAFLTFIIMTIQFESPKFSLVVMTTIPFNLIGLLGLSFVTDSPINMVSMLEFLVLIGTVTNNGILYVETVNQLLAEMPLDQALVGAGATRMRPILMATLTAVISMVPSALAYGKVGAVIQGLTFVNVGGLIAAMAPTLIVLPTYCKLVRSLGRESLGFDGGNIPG